MRFVGAPGVERVLEQLLDLFAEVIAASPLARRSSPTRSVSPSPHIRRTLRQSARSRTPPPRGCPPIGAEEQAAGLLLVALAHGAAEDRLVHQVLGQVLGSADLVSVLSARTQICWSPRCATLAARCRPVRCQGRCVERPGIHHLDAAVRRTHDRSNPALDAPPLRYIRVPLRDTAKST